MAELLGKVMAPLVSLAMRTEKDRLFDTAPDFEHTDGFRKRLCVVGLTGAGKSTLLNVMAGWSFKVVKIDGSTTYKMSKEMDIDGQKVERGELFQSGSSSKSVTDHTSFALVDYFGDPEKPLMLIDTPGHDDTSDDPECKGLTKIEADLTNKLKKLGYVNAILVIHNDVVGNRLNPATLELLRKLDAKFHEVGSAVWDHVIIGYSKCNEFEDTWRANFQRKKTELQQTIKEKIPSCKIDIPIVALGGLKNDQKKVEGKPGSEENTGFEQLWKFLSDEKKGNLSTESLMPFKGIQEVLRDEILARDEALHQVALLNIYTDVMFKLLLFLMFLFIRNGILPAWMSMILLLNSPYIIDEVILVSCFLWAVGPRDVWGSLQVFYDKWIKERLFPDKAKQA